jgi:hypothetical protein
MPMSKKKTIYKPKKGKRISQKKLYKLPKQHGGDFMTDVKNFFTGGQDPTDGTPLDKDDRTKDDSAMNVEEKPTEDPDDSAMDVEEKTTEDAADNSAMDEEKTTEDADDSKKEVDSEENSSNLATKASEVGTLIGDSAKSVFNEGVSAVTQPSDEADESEPFAGQSDDDVEKSDDVDALKQENETLKQEISELKSKLIDKLEQENETLKQGTQQPENSFGEQPESSFGQEPSDNSFGEQEKPGSLDLTDSNDSESNVISSLDNSNENQESSDGSFSTINLDSENMTTMDDKSPDFELGSDISPIELKRTDSQTPTGGTKHKKKKQRRTRRKNHGKR